MPHYTNNAELKDLVTRFKKLKKRMGRVKLSRLVEVLGLIAGGVWDRYEFTESKDDYVQDVLVLYLQRSLIHVNPELNIFSYLTTCAINFGHTTRTKSIRNRNAELHYTAEHVRESLRRQAVDYSEDREAMALGT